MEGDPNPRRSGSFATKSGRGSRPVPSSSRPDPRQALNEFRSAGIAHKSATAPVSGSTRLNRRDLGSMLVRKGVVIKDPTSHLLADPTPSRGPEASRMTPTSEASKSATEQITSMLKTIRPARPIWQEQDEAQQEKRRVNKRSRDEGGLEASTSAPRVATARFADMISRRPITKTPHFTSDDIRVSKKTHLGTSLTLMRGNETIDVDMDSDSDHEPRRLALARKGTNPVPLMRAARKRQESSSSDEESSFPNHSSDEASSVEMQNESDSESHDDEASVLVKQEDDGDALDFSRLRPFGPPELIVLDSPPQITIPLPQISPEYHRVRPTPKQEPPSAPVVKALERVALPSNRMHETRQLPFLLRNLRKGFLLRCSDLGIPVRSKGKGKSTTIYLRYEVEGTSDVFETSTEDWRCPICSLHGTLPSRESLGVHLKWDHSEVLTEWKLQSDGTWDIRILLRDSTGARSPPPRPDVVDRVSREGHVEIDAVDRSFFPSVTLSPPASVHGQRTKGSITRPVTARATTTRETATPGAPAYRPIHEAFSPPRSQTLSSSATPALVKREDVKPFPVGPMRPTRIPLQEATPATSASLPTPSTGRSEQRSTTGDTTSIPSRTGGSATTGPTGTPDTSRTERPTPVAAEELRYSITPPPPDDPLGPAARPPYLPAESDYGGPTVYYSCRPGGATLFDLLGTLPMDDFGILGWAVLDKDDEIFQSDEVKDEHKVMHALWARWILLNRRKFIANYVNGVKDFIDHYWKIIHRAAGWDALRYYLLLLLANRFLTAKEVAECLKHYENHTGMEYWSPRP